MGAALQEHHALFLAASIACELLGAIAFIANWTVGAWLLVSLLLVCMCSSAGYGADLQSERSQVVASVKLCLHPVILLVLEVCGLQSDSS